MNLATCFDTEEDADVLLLLSTDMQPCSNRHDVESEAEHVQQHTAAEAPLPITSRTYRLHAVVLKSASAYFKACLTASWQQQPHRKRWRDNSGAAQATTADSSTDASCCFRYQVTETVEAWQLAAMDLLLRLMYGQQVPQDASSELLLQVLALADRYQAFDSASTVLDHMAWSSKHINSPGLLQHVGGVPAAIQALPVFQLLMVQCHSAAASILKGTDTSDQGDQVVAARQFVISRYRDVPAVIKSPSLKAQFCNLPFAAVVAWARSDELRVHSENCVVHLLSTWLQAQPTEPSDDDSMDEDERDQQAAALSRLQCRRASLLAEQVRVLHLGRCYQHLALPSAKWFHESNSCKTHLPMLLAAQGVCKGRRVIPAPVWGPDGRAYSARELFAWCGPDQWLEAPRTACGASDSERVFDWLLTTAEVEALLMRNVHQFAPTLPQRLPTGGATLGVGAAPRRGGAWHGLCDRL